MESLASWRPSAFNHGGHMVLHRFIITPLSPWITPLRSDTLNGLLASRIAEDEGEEAVRQCLDAFLSGQEPFAVSSAMPAGFLPMPKQI